MRAALLAIALLACTASTPSPADYAPPELCIGCHPSEALRWLGSHHAQAMAPATPATVLGDFGGITVGSQRVERDGGAFVFVDADHRRYRVRYTFGVAPLQQYLVDGADGRMQVIPLAWDVARRAWFRIPGDDLAWTGRYHTWNTMCADCHSTAVRKNYDATTGRFATTFAEVAVGCQACHGPGSRHAADPRSPLAMRGDTEACAPCHARRSAIAAQPAGESLFDSYRPVTLGPGLYFADGQIRDEVFEYGSFAQSAMHAAGVRCVDCHDPHGARTAPSNATCTRCHRTSPPPQFPGLAKRPTDVDSPAHHHHQPGSPGARCVACHMPERVYMGIDRRHDHGFRIPRPDLAATLGTPDVCTAACHSDRDASWSVATVKRWFPHEPRASAAGAFARAAAGEDAVADLDRIARDRSAPMIVQATALELLQASPEACLAAARDALHSPSPLVRDVAVACTEAATPAERARLVAPALRDPVRLVRIEAARVLAGVELDREDATAYASARTELDTAIRGDLDRPEGWFDLGLLAEAEHRPADAAALYEKALLLDPEFVPARANLANLRR